MYGHVNSTMDILGSIGNQLMELENALTHVAITTDVSPVFMQTLENKLRGLRDLTNCLWATEVTRHAIAFGELGIRTFVGDCSIQIEIPYEMVTKTSLFRLFSKRLSSIPSLVEVTVAWHYLIRQLVDSLKKRIPFLVPLMKADVHVTVLCPDRRKRDPDHFWFRPIMDGLVLNGILADDSTGNVHLSFTYACEKDNPRVVLEVCPATS